MKFITEWQSRRIELSASDAPQHLVRLAESFDNRKRFFD
jgi:hypothetical protein